MNMSPLTGKGWKRKVIERGSQGYDGGGWRIPW